MLGYVMNFKNQQKDARGASLEFNNEKLANDFKKIILEELAKIMKQKNIKIKNASVRWREDKKIYEVRFYIDNVRYSAYGVNEQRLKINLKKKIAKITSPVIEEKTSHIILSDWFERWFNDYKKPALKKNSLDLIDTAFNLHIKPYLGNKTIDSITSDDLKFILKKLDAKTRMQTIVYINLRACLNVAVKKQLIKYNPFDDFVFVKDQGGKGSALSIIQQNKLVEILKQKSDVINIYFLFCLTTGARRTEAINLLYQNINFESGTVTLENAKRRKTQTASYRTLPLPAKIAKMIPKQDMPFKKLKERYVTGEFKKISDALGFEGITLNSLRHTFATRAVESGVDIKVVSKWMGHTTTRVTSDVYTEVQSEFEKQQQDKLNFNI